METSPSADSPAAEAADRAYDLCLRDGPRRGIIWRYRDIGVRLTGEGLAWRANDIDRKLAFSEIDSIRLVTGYVSRSGDFGTCTIRFLNGGVLFVTSVNTHGLPDRGKNAVYADFVRDLHARLSAKDRTRIRFVGGNTERFQAFGWFAVALGGAFFVALPIVLAVITGETKALYLCLAGLFLIWPTLRIVRKNQPRTYNPDRLDEDLLP